MRLSPVKPKEFCQDVVPVISLWQLGISRHAKIVPCMAGDFRVHSTHNDERFLCGNRTTSGARSEGAGGLTVPELDASTAPVVPGPRTRFCGLERPVTWLTITRSRPHGRGSR